jgi:hypothetical protein
MRKRRKWVENAAMWAIGLLAYLTAFPSAIYVHENARQWEALAVFVSLGLGVLPVLWYWRVLHLVLSLVSFAGIAIATAVLTAPILAWPSWHGLALLLGAAGIWTPASVVLFMVAGALARWRPYLGLFQRAIYLGTICWLGVVLIPLVR